MYMNAYQKYISELLDEYGPLLQRQLELMVNIKFKVQLPNLNAYSEQMCKFSDYEKTDISGDILISPKGIPPNYDIIRSFEVMLKFAQNIISHNKSNGNISIRFFVNTNEHNKEICIIPVRTGNERVAAAYANNKFGNEKCEIVIFLLDSKEQMKLINATCNCKFALVEKSGTVFFKK